MQFPQQIISELHVVGTTSRIDIDTNATPQPTIWFGNLDRSVQAFINAPASGTPTDFIGIGVNTSPFVNTVSGDSVRNRVFLQENIIDIGQSRISDQGGEGGRIQLADDHGVLYFTPGPSSNDFTSRVRCEDGEVRITGHADIGFGYNDADKELQRWNVGSFQTWTNLTLTAGWTASAGYYTPQYRMTADGLIELRGNMTAGTTADATAVITMPVVPAKFGLIRPCLEAGGTVNARLFYNTDGKIYVFGCAGATKMSLDGMRFSYK